MSKPKYIIVEGLIKSGKTALADILAKEYDARLILDNKENPFLEKFYNYLNNRQDSNALKTQLIYLINRYRQQQKITQKALFNETTVSDYIFYKDGIYAHATLNDDELEIYRKIFNIFTEGIPKADLIVYLQISFTEMIKRIKKSGTEIEKRVPEEYWREIFEAYNYYFFNLRNCPLLVVNMEKVDLTSQESLRGLMNEIKKHKAGIKYYGPA